MPLITGEFPTYSSAKRFTNSVCIAPSGALNMMGVTGLQVRTGTNQNLLMVSQNSMVTLHLIEDGGNTFQPWQIKAEHTTFPQVIPANANYGALSIGSGAFDGSTAGFFSGSALGTGLAINAASGFQGSLLDVQVAGVSQARVIYRASQVAHVLEVPAGGIWSSQRICVGGAGTDAATNTVRLDSSGAGLAMVSTKTLAWHSNTQFNGTDDTTLRRLGAGALGRIEAIPASANYGAFSIGNGPFDGSTAGFFTGSASGTALAVNAASGFTGRLTELQVAGVGKFRVLADGTTFFGAQIGVLQGTSAGIAFVSSFGGSAADVLVWDNNTSSWYFVNNGPYGAWFRMKAARLALAEGAAVASAAQVTLGSDGNVFHITGTTQTDLILNTNWQGGSTVTLIFDGILTVRHNQAASGNFKPIYLKALANLTTAAGMAIQLVYDATNSTWYQL